MCQEEGSVVHYKVCVRRDVTEGTDNGERKGHTESWATFSRQRLIRFGRRGNVRQTYLSSSDKKKRRRKDGRINMNRQILRCIKNNINGKEEKVVWPL